jgi:hypothetical protein
MLPHLAVREMLAIIGWGARWFQELPTSDSHDAAGRDFLIGFSTIDSRIKKFTVIRVLTFW